MGITCNVDSDLRWMLSVLVKKSPINHSTELASIQESYYINGEDIYMNTISSPGISAALLILFNLLYFVFIMLLISLFIERIWIDSFASWKQ